MTDEVFIAEESVSIKLAEPAAPPTPAIPATPTVPATPQKEIALATTKVKTDSTPISEITARQADKKDMIAKIQATSQPQQGVPVMEEVSEETAACLAVISETGVESSEAGVESVFTFAVANAISFCGVAGTVGVAGIAGVGGIAGSANLEETLSLAMNTSSVILFFRNRK